MQMIVDQGKLELELDVGEALVLCDEGVTHYELARDTMGLRLRLMDTGRFVYVRDLLFSAVSAPGTHVCTPKCTFQGNPDWPICASFTPGVTPEICLHCSHLLGCH